MELSCEKTLNVFGEVLTHTHTHTHTHTFILLPPSRLSHLSEQNRGSLRVISLFGDTNKSNRALHHVNFPPLHHPELAVT